jgi:hypothetical protein
MDLFRRLLFGESKSSRLVVVVGFLAAAAIAALVLTDFPADGEWRDATYVFLGVVATLWVADTAHRVQSEIRNFLMGRVNSRLERTDAVIELCRAANHEFRAATFFPAVGVRDDPERAPTRYMAAIEDALERGVEVTLVSISLDEALAYSRENKFDQPCLDALERIELRMRQLDRRFKKLMRIEVVGKAITVNVCHNESAALIYHMSLGVRQKEAGDDFGAGFKSSDARIVAIAKGGFSRYRQFSAVGLQTE